MLLGSLSLEADNFEFWIALGCLSGHKALRQHAFIRALQLDVSLASSWAYLGKVVSLALSEDSSFLCLLCDLCGF